MTPPDIALPAMDHVARRDRLRARLVASGCEAFLVTRAVDVRYLSGFTGSNGTLIVGGSPDADVLITDARYSERVHALDVPHIEIGRGIGAVLGALGAVPLGVDAEHVTLATAARLEEARGGRALVRTSGLVAGLRAHKDAAEVARIRWACAITSAVLHDVALEGPPPDVSERALARDVERAFIERGADGVAFPTIIASGPNGASPHHEAGDRPLGIGDLVTIDCGAEVDGYRADMTRTYAVGGDASALPQRLHEVHALVVAANAAGRAAARPGGEVAAVDRAARSLIAEAGYGDAFVHPTGHGIGLDVHEAPLVTDPSAASLSPGTTFTVEPGIYLPGIGGVRIEDSLVVLDATVDVLTDLERGPAPTRSDGA